MKKNTQLRSAIRRNATTGTGTGNSTNSSSSTYFTTRSHVKRNRNSNSSWTETKECWFGIINNTTRMISTSSGSSSSSTSGSNPSNNGYFSSSNNNRTTMIRSFAPVCIAILFCYAFFHEYSLLETQYHRIAASMRNIELQHKLLQQQQNVEHKLSLSKLSFVSTTEPMMTEFSNQTTTTTSSIIKDGTSSSHRNKIEVEIVNKPGTATKTNNNNNNQNSIDTKTKHVTDEKRNDNTVSLQSNSNKSNLRKVADDDKSMKKTSVKSVDEEKTMKQNSPKTRVAKMDQGISNSNSNNKGVATTVQGVAEQERRDNVLLFGTDTTASILKQVVATTTDTTSTLKQVAVTTTTGTTTSTNQQSSPKQKMNVTNDHILLFRTTKPSKIVDNSISKAKSMLLTTFNPLSRQRNKQQQQAQIGGAIETYLQKLGKKFVDKIILLQWDTISGKLIKTTPIQDLKLLPKKSLHFFESVQPSSNNTSTSTKDYGTIALLLNTNDVLQFPWNIIPPIPVLTYTIPKSLLLSANNNTNTKQHFIQIPNPYERDGWSITLTWFAAKVTTPYEQRKNVIMWRDTDHYSLANRKKLLELSQGDPKHVWLNAGIYNHFSKKMELYEMAEYKYQLEIGDKSGVTWSGVRWKMCTGNLVLLVESDYVDWWYPTIEAYKHYIPIKNDLSDLKQQYDWIESHPDIVQEIIQQGKTICKFTSTTVKVKSFHKQTLLNLLKPVSDEGLMIEATELLTRANPKHKQFWNNVPRKNTFDSSTGEQIIPAEKLPAGVIPDRTPIESFDAVSIYATPSTSITRYLEAAAYPEMITLLKWNASGILETMSPIDIPDWLPDRAVTNLFQYTQPSKYGTVAFLLNTDVLATVPWDYIPPIPLLTYTLPNRWEHRLNKDFFLLPTPYDRDGYNRGCIEQAKKATDEVTFMDRKNVLVWRGIPHGKSDQNRYKLFEMSKNDPNNAWLDAVNIDEDKTKYMTRTEMSNYRYQLDIGGESGTTWGSLRWKMCSGNLVFKVNSWSKDWWHETIKPYEHYIPVKEDLSDLKVQYDWVENNMDKVLNIVEQAKTVCMSSSTYDAVEAYQKDILLQKLPAITTTSEALIKEADAILYNKLGSFYSKIENRPPKQ